MSDRFNVIVCGAGPAGIGAAIAAGRAGAKTLLIERLGHVGGMHTGAGVTNWCDSPGGPIFDELFNRMAALDSAKYRMEDTFVAPGRAQMDTEMCKVVAVQMLLEASVTPLLLTHTDAAIIETGCVKGVTVINKSGRTDYLADCVIDATADADVAASAGAPFLQGDPDDGRVQHCNFRVWYEGIDAEAYEANKPTDEQILTWVREAHASGAITPPDYLFQPQRELFPYNQRYGKIQLTSWEFEKVDTLDTLQLSRLLSQCYVAALQVMQFCRKHLPGYEQMRIRKMPSVLGVRETRRIVGQYQLTHDDVLAARKFDDGIALCHFFMDLHDSPPGTTLPFPKEHIWENRPPKGESVEIPYRCLVPREVDRLLVVGRSISADRKAHGATRVMPTCMFTGHASGLAAAQVSQRNCSTHDVDVAAIRRAVGITAE